MLQDVEGGQLRRGIPTRQKAYGWTRCETCALLTSSWEAVYKTVLTFLQEVEGKAVRLYCDTKIVVAMLGHFTWRNPELMWWMFHLGCLMDLHNIQLKAICGEANVWADELPRSEDLDDWQLHWRQFERAKEQWIPHAVDCFASEI
ncbi:hypothetical protein CYMTET_38514 [Cymbomonas tetramitiformis]|uniref:RNase H type-1 domain-containing protein n=1 Tax=Cymbomonas tetramitiformis TaxID=36881 RepID=A0AAE0CDF2_9CHLO|nr:hypothetical protein CYMTET_38514 [Cymbomonas tetramitiformis]